MVGQLSRLSTAQLDDVTFEYIHLGSLLEALKVDSPDCQTVTDWTEENNVYWHCWAKGDYGPDIENEGAALQDAMRTALGLDRRIIVLEYLS